MTLPTKEYNAGVPDGTFDTWGGSTISADAMINDFVDLIEQFFPAGVHFDFYEVFTKATATADSILEQTGVLTQVGTNGTPGWSKATEAVWTLKSTTNGLYKISMLDIGTGNSFEKIVFSTLTGGALAFIDYLVDGTHGWAARDDGKPNTFLQISYGLNKALRRKYNLN